MGSDDTGRSSSDARESVFSESTKWPTIRSLLLATFSVVVSIALGVQPVVIQTNNQQVGQSRLRKRFRLRTLGKFMPKYRSQYVVDRNNWGVRRGTAIVADWAETLLPNLRIQPAFVRLRRIAFKRKRRNDYKPL